MEVPKVFESEYRLCLILWENEQRIPSVPDFVGE